MPSIYWRISESFSSDAPTMNCVVQVTRERGEPGTVSADINLSGATMSLSKSLYWESLRK